MNSYITSYFRYQRRATSTTQIGALGLGSHYPIRIQSMANTDTNDIEASVNQAIDIAQAGGELVRFTAQGIREAQNLSHIHANLHQKGYTVPLVADIHFNPKVAEEAALHVEKVRINPGNFVAGKEGPYTEAEFNEEIEKIATKLHPLIAICKEKNRAIRIGVNHGSLSPRIMDRYGDTPEGLAASCMEFLRLCESMSFTNIVLSIKASNTLVMVQAVRILVSQMDQANMHYPLHLGVTEAGDGEDGRIKSAVGIGTLLVDGLGDTIRVSLSESPAAEIPVANKLVSLIHSFDNVDYSTIAPNIEFDPYHYNARRTHLIGLIGSERQAIVVHDASNGRCANFTQLTPDYIYWGAHQAQNEIPAIIDAEFWQQTPNTYPLYAIESLTDSLEAIPTDKLFVRCSEPLTKEHIRILSQHHNIILWIEHRNVQLSRLLFHQLIAHHILAPVILSLHTAYNDEELFQLHHAMHLGALLLDGFGNGICLHNPTLNQIKINSAAFAILQAARVRISRTEYISCPSCGRTLFDLQSTIAKVKAATSHLSHLKIAIMGCIVNGPGEMADADYGYVGAGKGKISLYKKHHCIEKNIPEEEAVEKLIALINKFEN